MARPKIAVADSDTIMVRVPITFRSRGGRKVLTVPDGSPAFTLGRPEMNRALLKAIVRAFRWRRLIEAGQYDTIQDIATAEKVNASYVGRILRLSLLAPDIVVTILDASTRRHATLTVEMLMKPFPVDWEAQRRKFV